MNITFNLEYLTSYGEEIFLNIKKNDAATVERLAMTTADGTHWTLSREMPLKSGHTLNYYYSVARSGADIRHEWLVAPHKLEIITGAKSRYTLYDRWIDNPEDSYLYSSAFTDCVMAHTCAASSKSTAAKVLRLKVRAPQLRGCERLAIIGDDEFLGGWEALKALPMTEHAPGEWVATIDAEKLARPVIEFKFVVLNEEADVTPMWEDGANRSIVLPDMQKGDVVVYELYNASFQIYPWRGAGTVVPVFALRSEGSYGVGDFGDLVKMIDWVSSTNQRILQVLPINDTGITHTWTDSYPYNSISIYALHPQYTDLRQLPQLKDATRRDYYERLRQELNALPQIDYERVNNAKTEYLRELFAQEWGRVARRAAFKQFFAANREWLVPYAAFCHYRDLYGTATFSRWPDHKQLSADERWQMEDPDTAIYKEVAFWYYVQYNLDTQMRAAHDHARATRVILKGDIPIGISRDGVEAWVEPGYFNLDGQAGAPPDAFSTNGQNWGFPTYNWQAMLADGCRWWVRRFTKMAEYFDAYRIDHVLGFFRIWEIPIHAVHGLLGQFSPSQGMSREEIESYGLWFQEELFTQPFITEWVLDRVFGNLKDEVASTYLDPAGDSYRYRMKPQYSTQRKVEEAFRGKTSEKDILLRDGLYALISDVLFVPDRTNPNLFHPRIAVQTDFIYESLYDSDKRAFNSLYNEYFYRRNNRFWYDEAMKKLPRLVEATRMLVCAEDLGMVPDCVPWVMDNLRILSLEIQSMPKDDKVRFGHLSQNPYRSVCTISTHDMPTLRQWWDEDGERTQDYYASRLYRTDGAPHPLPGWLAKDIVARHLACPSMLCLLSLQDWLAIDERLRLPDADAERINIPANPRHYWRYRMHITIEQLAAATDFNNEVRELVGHSGRNTV